MKVFISYRRADSAGYAGHLYDSLKRRIGAANLFIDIDSLEPGEDFVEKIETTVAAADVVLALIGPQWLALRDEQGRRRIDAPLDWVRLELEASLQRDDVVVIPVLVQGATMPGPDELPPSIAPLARRNAFVIGPRLSDDVPALMTAIRHAAERASAVAEPAEPAVAEPAATKAKAQAATIRSVVQTNIELPHPKAVRALAYAGSEVRLATASADGSAHLWSVDPVHPVHQWALGREPVDVAADGRLVAVLTAGAVAMFKPADGSGAGSLVAFKVRSIALVGSWLVMSHRDGTAGTYWVGEGDAGPPPTGLAAAHRDDGTLVVWDLSDLGSPVRELPHPDRVSSVALSPDQSLVAASAHLGRIGVWRVADGERVQEFDMDADASAVAFHPSGAWLAAVGRSPKIRLWNVVTGQPGPELHGDGPQSDVAFSPSGRRLAVASMSGVVRLWTILA